MTRPPHLFYIVLILLVIVAYAPGCAASAVDRVTDGLCSFANSLSEDPSQNTCNQTQETTP